jgi:hypothetical protein
VQRSTVVFILGIAVVARIATAVAMNPSTESLIASAHHEHASIAKNLAEGRGFRFNFFGDIERPDFTSQQAPFVPSLLAASYRAFGVESQTALWFVVALQVIAGSLSCVFVADAVAQLNAPRMLARLAGAHVALYPPLAVSSLHLQALPWNILWISLMLAGAARVTASANHGMLLLAAGAIGGLYTDPILAALLAALSLWILVQLKADSIVPLVKVGAATGIALAPWIARNYEVHGRFEFVKNSLPYVFWQGNTLLSSGTDKIPVDAVQASHVSSAAIRTALATAEASRRRSVSVNDVALTEADLRELAALPNEAARMDWFWRRVRSELASNPLHYPHMCLVRLKHWLWFDETNPKSFVPVYRLSYLALLGAALVGLLVRSRALTPFLWAALALTLVHVMIITSARFRVCFELLLIPVAANAIWQSWQLVPQGFRRGRLPTLAKQPS